MSTRNIVIRNIKTRQKVKLLDLSKKNKNEARKATEHELFEWIAFHEGTYYDSTALAMRRRSRFIKLEGEGHSERSIRHMLGLPYDNLSIPTSSESLDIPELIAEIKDVVKHNVAANSYTLQSIKLNQVSRDTWSNCRSEVERCAGYSGLCNELKSRINEGKLTSNMVKTMPDDVRDTIFDFLAPVNTMRKYRSMFCGGFECYLRIDSTDFNKAFELEGITMGGCVKYKLRRRYLVERIVRIIRRSGFVETSLSACDEPSFELFGHLTSETSVKFLPHEVSMMMANGKKTPLDHLFQSTFSLLSRLRQRSQSGE